MNFLEILIARQLPSLKYCYIDFTSTFINKKFTLKIQKIRRN